MDQGNFARGIHVGMGIGIGFSSMGSPSSVSNAHVVAMASIRMLGNQVNAISLVSITCIFGDNLRLGGSCVDCWLKLNPW